ncbi:hypothetical protein V6N13_006253 [Hibiscus sabdariffa]|uniref:Uncharacterized protein n=1 Tax=Hibiscus sabdariffa TaxID=183260 RepID=A0ABR2ENG0_9ROSI
MDHGRNFLTSNWYSKGSANNRSPLTVNNVGFHSSSSLNGFAYWIDYEWKSIVYNSLEDGNFINGLVMAASEDELYSTSSWNFSFDPGILPCFLMQVPYFKFLDEVMPDYMNFGTF